MHHGRISKAVFVNGCNGSLAVIQEYQKAVIPETGIRPIAAARAAAFGIYSAAGTDPKWPFVSRSNVMSRTTKLLLFSFAASWVCFFIALEVVVIAKTFAIVFVVLSVVLAWVAFVEGIQAIRRRGTDD